MEPDVLRDHLAKLHAELASTQRVDTNSSALLAEIMQDIKRLMSEPPAAAPPPDDSLPERLERVAVQFEVNHPTLAASSRRLIDILGKAGL